MQRPTLARSAHRAACWLVVKVKPQNEKGRDKREFVAAFRFFKLGESLLCESLFTRFWLNFTWVQTHCVHQP